MVRFWKIVSTLAVILLALTILMPVSMSSTASASDTVINQNTTIYFYYKSGCPHCALVEPLIQSLAAKYPQVNFVWLEIGSNSANMAQWLDLNSRYNVTTPVVPEVFIGGQVLVAENAIQTNLEPMILNLINGNTVNSPSNAEPASVGASTNLTSPSTNNIVEGNATSKAPTEGNDGSTSSPDNGTMSAIIIKGVKPSSEAGIGSR